MASSTKRERELARLRAQRQAARRAAREAERRKRRNAILAGLSALAVAAVIVVIALVTNDGSSPSSVSQQPTASAGPCTYLPTGKPTKPVTGLPASEGPTEKKDVQVKMLTNRGEIDLTLDGAKAPCTTNSFAFLAAQKYFNATSCHRLTTTGIFVLQCGDPGATGGGGPGYSFQDENLSALDTKSCTAEQNATAVGAGGQGCQVVYPRGTIAMANSGKNTNGSQFFLVYKNSPLNPQYTPFGRITKGLEILDAVAKGGSIPVGDGKPKLPVLLKTVTVVS